jgi:hypothetical protein
MDNYTDNNIFKKQLKRHNNQKIRNLRKEDSAKLLKIMTRLVESPKIKNGYIKFLKGNFEVTNELKSWTMYINKTHGYVSVGVVANVKYVSKIKTYVNLDTQVIHYKLY